MLANLGGSFLIAFFLTLATGRLNVPPEIRLFVAVGFLGGFTTFSSLTFETFRLVEQSGWGTAGLNLTGSMFLGMVAVLLGVFLAQWLQGGG